MKLLGPYGRERLVVKSFPSADAMHRFLNKQTNNDWQEVKPPLPVKAGTYARVAGMWKNVRSLEPSLLAHI
jgi:hypothetical protein